MGRKRTKEFSQVMQRVLQALGVAELADLARALEAPEGTVRNWHKRGKVPGIWLDKVAAMTKKPRIWFTPTGDWPNAATGAPSVLASSGYQASGLASTLRVAEGEPAPWKNTAGAREEPDTHLRGVPPASRGAHTQTGAASGLLRPRGAEAVLPLVLSLPQGGEEGLNRMYELIPKHVRTAAAGPGNGSAVADEVDLAGELAFSFNWLRHNMGHTTGRLSTIQVRGDSMAKTLLDGDTVMIDEGVSGFEVDGIYVFDFGGRRLIKRVQQMWDGSLVLISDNPNYKQQEIPRDRARDVQVVGRMVWPRV